MAGEPGKRMARSRETVVDVDEPARRFCSLRDSTIGHCYLQLAEESSINVFKIAHLELLFNL